jgi:gluconolactonase
MGQTTIVAEGLGFPEGPIVCPDGSVLVVEIKRGTITRCWNGRTEVVANVGGGPNGAAIGPDGACYVCNNGGFSWFDHPELGVLPHGPAADYTNGRIERVDLTTGKVELLYDRVPEGMLSGPNDIVFDAHGGFWFSDLGKRYDRSAAHGGIYYAKADGSEIREVAYPMVTPNGVGLSPDGKQLYVAESNTGRVWRFDIAAPGQVAPGPATSRSAGHYVFGSPHFQIFDSLAMEANGNVAVAAAYRGGIEVVSPAGKEVEFVPMPDPITTNIAFGGEDMRTAYVTLSGTGQLAKVDWARPGLKLNY